MCEAQIYIRRMGVEFAHMDIENVVWTQAVALPDVIWVWGFHWYSCLWNRFQPDINKPGPSKSHTSKDSALGGGQQGSRSWKKHPRFLFFSGIFLCNGGKNVSLIFGEKKEIRSSFRFGFSLNSRQRWGYSAPSLPISTPLHHLQHISAS